MNVRFSVLYNDNDPFCCGVLRARIADGRLPNGVVDSRSISDVPAEELKQYKQIHLFAGIGGFPLALQMCNFGRDRSILTAGFPCQDISTAGKGAGLEGDRSGLWWETLAAISVVRPEFVILENVSALLARGLGVVLGSLASLGYRVEWHCVPASHVGAPHRRDRIWIVGVREYVADTDHDGSEKRYPERGEPAPEGEAGDVVPRGEAVADAKVSGKRPRLREGGSSQKRGRRSGNIGGEDDATDTECERGRSGETDRENAKDVGKPSRSQGFRGWGTECRLNEHPNGLQPGLDSGCGGWECGVPRVARGQKDRAKRLKALGNAIVPQCAAFVLRHVLSGSIEKGPERHTVESHGSGDQQKGQS